MQSFSVESMLKCRDIKSGEGGGVNAIMTLINFSTGKDFGQAP